MKMRETREILIAMRRNGERKSLDEWKEIGKKIDKNCVDFVRLAGELTGKLLRC